MKNQNITNGMLKSKNEHLSELQSIAESYGGKVISKEYINSYTKLIFEDCMGNLFPAEPRMIKEGHWSPYERNISEHICRQAFESLFQVKFPITNDIIKRNGNKNLQLDGYNDDVIVNGKSYKIAFEYQGYSSHRNDIKTIERDEYKRKYCLKNNINLFIIEPFDYKYIRSTDYIATKIYQTIYKCFNLTLEFVKHNIKIDFTKLNHNTIKLDFWNSYGLEYGVELLDNEYINNNQKMTWRRISDGYCFKRSPRTIYSSGFPKVNSNISKGQLKTSEEHLLELKQIAERHNGKLLSNEYINNRTKLLFEDSNGNQFYMEPSGVKRGYWSPFEKYSKSKTKFSL